MVTKEQIKSINDWLDANKDLVEMFRRHGLEISFVDPARAEHFGIASAGGETKLYKRESWEQMWRRIYQPYSQPDKKPPPE